MSWNKTQNEMIHELNGSVFSKDPIHRVYDPMCPIDVQNTNYVMESVAYTHLTLPTTPYV